MMLCLSVVLVVVVVRLVNISDGLMYNNLFINPSLADLKFKINILSFSSIITIIIIIIITVRGRGTVLHPPHYKHSTF